MARGPSSEASSVLLLGLPPVTHQQGDVEDVEWEMWLQPMAGTV